jgi:excisionase family DNA binding protein
MTPAEYGLRQVSYTVTQTARVLGIGRPRVFEEIKKGSLPSFKPGKRDNLILAVEIAALLDKWRAEPSKKYLVKRAADKRAEVTLEELGL